MPISIAIVAGGNSKRFKGTGDNNKIFFEIKGTGKKLVNVIYDRFKPLSDEIFIQTSEANSLEIRELFPKDNVYIDTISNKGPLSGIYSALLHAKHDGVFIVAADMPYVDVNLFLELRKHHDYEYIVPKWRNGYIEPLCAVYNKKLLPRIKERLNNDLLKVTHVFNGMEENRIKYVDIDELIGNKKINERCFTNINYLTDTDIFL